MTRRDYKQLDQSMNEVCSKIVDSAGRELGELSNGFDIRQSRTAFTDSELLSGFVF